MRRQRRCVLDQAAQSEMASLIGYIRRGMDLCGYLKQGSMAVPRLAWYHLITMHAYDHYSTDDALGCVPLFCLSLRHHRTVPCLMTFGLLGMSAGRLSDPAPLSPGLLVPPWSAACPVTDPGISFLPLLWIHAPPLYIFAGCSGDPNTLSVCVHRTCGSQDKRACRPDRECIGVLDTQDMYKRDRHTISKALVCV